MSAAEASKRARRGLQHTCREHVDEVCDDTRPVKYDVFNATTEDVIGRNIKQQRRCRALHRRMHSMIIHTITERTLTTRSANAPGLQRGLLGFCRGINRERL